MIQLLTLRAVCARTSLSRSTIYTLQAAGKFPHSVPVSAGRVAWIESEIAAYIESCVAQRAPLVDDTPTPKYADQ